MFGFAHARAGDRVSCGKNDETYEIVGGISFINSHGRLAAGSLDSRSSCPCKAGLIPSFTNSTYESRQDAAPPAARSAPPQEAAPATPNNPVAPEQSSFTSARAPSPTLSERPGTVCENINERMPFVLRAAKQFDDLLHSDKRKHLERSIRDTAWGGGVR